MFKYKTKKFMCLIIKKYNKIHTSPNDCVNVTSMQTKTSVLGAKCLVIRKKPLNINKKIVLAKVDSPK